MKLVFVPLKDVFKECKGKRQFSIKKDAYRRFSSVSNEMQIGIKKIAALYNGDANYYLMEAYKHLKPIALAGDARKFKATIKVADQGEEGIVEADSADGSFMDELLTLMAAHRVWSRIPKIDKIPA